LRTFIRPMPAEYPSQNFVIAIFFSVTIHLFLALLFCKMTTDRITVKPVTPSISRPLIVSLTTLPVTSNDDLARNSEAEIIVTVKKSEVPVSKTPIGTPPATDATSHIDKKVLYQMKIDFDIRPEFKFDDIETSISKGVSGYGASVDNSLAHYLTPSYGLESVKRFEQVFGEILESELQRKKIEWRVDYIKKYEASLPPDCSTYYMKKSFNGLFAIPLIIKDAISDSDNACTW
jgi:hypothetical protein